MKGRHDENDVQVLVIWFFPLRMFNSEDVEGV